MLIRGGWFGVAVLCLTSSASASFFGITSGCDGCHSPATGATFQGGLSLESSEALEPGSPAEFTLRIEESTMPIAGFFISPGAIGTLTATSGNRVENDALVHNRPLKLVDGAAEVKFTWTPPVEPGGVDFTVWSVAGNDQFDRSGDVRTSARFSFVWGCEPVTVYSDFDGDGYASDVGDESIGCDARDGWVLLKGDCDDIWPSIHPGATETWNNKDDDCNGETDDGIVVVAWYPDVDGDGFGSGDGVQAEVGPEGYVPVGGDCDDSDAEISPDAPEICDGKDNDCSLRADDGIDDFVVCGVGACARVIHGCEAQCVPGTPTSEVCNGLDDDCDEEVDDEATCPEGSVCEVGRCQAAASLGAMDASVDQDAGQDAGIAEVVDAASFSYVDASAAGPSRRDAGGALLRDAAATTDTSALQSVADGQAPTNSGDAGARTASSRDSGCDCRVTGTRASGTGVWVGLGLALVAAFVRRRRFGASRL